MKPAKILLGIGLIVGGLALLALVAWTSLYWFIGLTLPYANPIDYIVLLPIAMIAAGLYMLGILKHKGETVKYPSGKVYKSDGTLADERKEGQS